MTRRVVIDASALVEFILSARDCPAISELVGDETCEILVPHLCDIEVTSALCGTVRRGVLGAGRGEEALALYAELPLSRFDHLPFLPRVLELRDNFTAYDSVYVALAEAAGAPLHTADGRLAQAIRRHTGLEAVEV